MNTSLIKKMLGISSLCFSHAIMYAQAPTTADGVFKKYVAAMGGEKGFNSVKDMKVRGTGNMQGMALTVTEIKKAPDKCKQTVETGGAVVQKQVYNGKTGYMEANGAKMAIAGDDLAELARSADIAMDLHPAKYGFKRSLKGTETLNGNKVYLLEVVDGTGKKSKEYYDATTYLLVKKVQGTGDKMQVSEFSDYRNVPGTAGYKMPYIVSETEAGQSFTETVTSIEVNKGVADSEFN